MLVERPSMLVSPALPPSGQAALLENYRGGREMAAHDETEPFAPAGDGIAEAALNELNGPIPGIRDAWNGKAYLKLLWVASGELGRQPLERRVLLQPPDRTVHRTLRSRGVGMTSVDADRAGATDSFVVGRATVELLSTGGLLELRPGVLGVLRRGERTRWNVQETLRKVYQITLAPTVPE